mgnify:CR=1 FL=1
MDKGLLLVISAPSGGGKGTILKELFAQDENLRLSVSATTRGPLAPQRASWAGSAMTVSRAAARPARSP